MLNYIKSEFYRISRTKNVYGFTIFFVVLSVVINSALFWPTLNDSNFIYGNTSFSYSLIVEAPLFFGLLSAILTTAIYDRHRASGSLKNTVGFGISRIKIFTGMSIVTVVVSTIVMLIILITYVLSASVLLEHTGAVTLNDIVGEVCACYFTSVASVISTLLFLELTPRFAIFLWLAIWCMIPDALYQISKGIEPLHQLTMLLPNNLFEKMDISMSTSMMVWGTPGGMLLCVLVGLAHVILFYCLSILLVRRKDV